MFIETSAKAGFNIKVRPIISYNMAFDTVRSKFSQIEGCYRRQ